MTRRQLITSDEYIKTNVECIVVSNKTVNKTRAELNSFMIDLKNELIDESPPPADWQAVFEKTFPAIKNVREHDAQNLKDGFMEGFKAASRSIEIPADWQEWLNKESEKAAFQVPYDGTNKFYNEDILFGFNACFNAMLPFIEELKEGEAKQSEYATKYFDENTKLRQQIEEKEKEIERLKAELKEYNERENDPYWCWPRCDVEGCEGVSCNGGGCWRETGYWSVCDKHSDMWRKGGQQPKMKQSAIDREATRDPVTGYRL